MPVCQPSNDAQCWQYSPVWPHSGVVDRQLKVAAVQRQWGFQSVSCKAAGQCVGC